LLLDAVAARLMDMFFLTAKTYRKQVSLSSPFQPENGH